MVTTPEQAVAAEAGLAGPPPRAPTDWRPPAAAAGIVLAVAWLVLRPASPSGVAAVVDLLVLPAVLFAELRLLAGRTTVRPSVFAVLFGLGAVFSVVTAVVIERGAGLVLGRSAMSAVGPLAEAAALSVPLFLVVLLVGGRRPWTIADLTLAGLAVGLGFVLVQSSLATAAVHQAPDYQTPLLAGLQRVPASAGSPPVYFVGHALATALVGLALGIGLRLRRRTWRLVPATLALALVVIDHGVFDWRLHHLVVSEAADASGALEMAQRVSLEGRLALVLLVGGLIAARLIEGRRARPHAPAFVDLRETAEDEAAPEPGTLRLLPAEDEGVEPEADDDTEAGPETDAEADGELDRPGPSPRRVGPAWVPWLAMALAVGGGVALTLLARNRRLGLIDSRYVALAVSLLGLAYALWNLPSGIADRRGPALRNLLGAAAVVSSGLGVACSVLPSPDAATPVHGGLVLETVWGWGSQVGSLGLLLGLGGLVAPAGRRGRRRFGDRWSGLLVRKLRWTGWFGPSKGPRGGVAERVSWRGRDARRRRRRDAAGEGPGGSSWRARVRGGGWARLLRRADRQAAALRAGASTQASRALAIGIEPVYRAPAAHVEFVGATVKEAIEAAMRQVGVDLAHNSLQLVDEGMPAKPGKPGSGRPARVRVAAAGEDTTDNVLVPPARDSITRDTPFVVVVEVAGGTNEEPPPSVAVALRATHALRSHARVLTCAGKDLAPERARYRSNPYSVEGGEDTTWARTSAGTVAPAAAPMHVDNGGELRVEYRGERVTITVYDGWAQQVLGVNRWLLDLTRDHHRGALTTLERRLGDTDGTGAEADELRRRIRRLGARLESAEECHQMLGAAGGAGREGEDAARAFRSTALLHAAMSVDDQDAVPVQVDGADVDAGAYREFLAHTVVGQLWGGGAYSVDDVASLLVWERFTDDSVGHDGAEPG